jgi:hypothetical protein
MVSNGLEQPETVQNGDSYIDGPCGGLIGVAVVWFAAGLMIAALMIAIWRVT